MNNLGTAAWSARHVFAVTPLFGMASGALYALVALTLMEGQIGEATIGAITSCYFAGIILGVLTSSALIRHLGYRPVFIGAAAAGAMTTLSFHVFEHEAAWFALRFINGLVLGTYHVIIETWVNLLASRTNRGRLFALYEALRIGAIAAGPAIVLLEFRLAEFSLVAAAYVLSIVPICFSKAPKADRATDQPAARRLDLLAVLLRFPGTIVIMFTIGLLNASFYGLGAAYGERIGLSSGGIAMFLGIVLFAPVLSAFPLGAAGDRWGRSVTILAAVGAAMAVAATLAALETPTSAIACILGGLVAGLIGPLYALSLGRMVDGARRREVTQLVTRAGLLAYTCGAVFGPLCAGLAMESEGPAGLYLWVSVCLAVGFLAALFDAKRQR